MTKSFPDYLKLHIEESSALKAPTADIQGLGAVLRTFQSVTGWQLTYAGTGYLEPPGTWSMPIGVPGVEDGKLVLTQDESIPTTASLPLEKIQPLAQAIGDLVTEMHRTQSTVWQREAELAAGIPVTLRPDEQHQLASRLESVLRGGAEAIGCQAAALYLLDDATSHLKLRAAWRLPKSRFLDAPVPCAARWPIWRRSSATRWHWRTLPCCRTGRPLKIFQLPCAFPSRPRPRRWERCGSSPSKFASSRRSRHTWPRSSPGDWSPTWNVKCWSGKDSAAGRRIKRVAS